jgi:hypothetical protein
VGNVINLKDISAFYQRLNHHGYGLTELAIIDPTGTKGIIATGFFSNQASFVRACQAYNGRYNIYASRNPRPRWLPKVVENYLDVRYKQRAKDKDIEYITAISLDIDPIRPRGRSSSDSEHKMALDFALKLQQQIGGWVDDSGNGAYLWLPFADPIGVTDRNRKTIKDQCQQWQRGIKSVHQPENYRLRIDGCFDLSRIKKVIGTLSLKGDIHRLSRLVVKSKTSNDVRDAIISMPLGKEDTKAVPISPSSHLSAKFIKLLQGNTVIRQLWCSPDQNHDTSMHDWKLGCACLEAGITNPDEMAAILRRNPFGKFQRDRRYSYLTTTVRKLIANGAQ